MSAITDFLAKFRSVLNESSAGFFADSTDLYPYLDLGQNRCWQELLKFQKQVRKQFDPTFESEALKSLITHSDIAKGTKAYITDNFTTPTGDLTFTAVQAGTDGNNIQIVPDDTSTSAITITCTYVSNWVITMKWKGGTHTCQDIADAINAHAIASTLVVVTTTTPTAKIVTNHTSPNLANGAGGNTFLLPSDITEVHSIELVRTSSVADTLPITFLPFSDFRKRTLNSYTGHNYDSSVTHKGEVLSAIDSGTTIVTSFSTWDSYWEYLRVYYYKKPSTVSSTQGFTLPYQCWETILHFALYYALLKAKIDGTIHLQQALQSIQGL